MIVNLKQSALIAVIGLILLSPILSLSGNTFHIDDREIYSFKTKDICSYPEDPDKKIVNADSISPDIPEMIVMQDNKPIIRYPITTSSTQDTSMIYHGSTDEGPVIQDVTKVVDVPQINDNVEHNGLSDTTQTHDNKKKTHGSNRHGHRS